MGGAALHAGAGAALGGAELSALAVPAARALARAALSRPRRAGSRSRRAVPPAGDRRGLRHRRDLGPRRAASAAGSRRWACRRLDIYGLRGVVLGACLLQPGAGGAAAAAGLARDPGRAVPPRAPSSASARATLPPHRGADAARGAARRLRAGLPALHDELRGGADPRRRAARDDARARDLPGAALRLRPRPRRLAGADPVRRSAAASRSPALRLSRAEAGFGGGLGRASAAPLATPDRRPPVGASMPRCSRSRSSSACRCGAAPCGACRRSPRLPAAVWPAAAPQPRRRARLGRARRSCSALAGRRRPRAAPAAPAAAAAGIEAAGGWRSSSPLGVIGSGSSCLCGRCRLFALAPRRSPRRQRRDGAALRAARSCPGPRPRGPQLARPARRQPRHDRLGPLPARRLAGAAPAARASPPASPRRSRPAISGRSPSSRRPSSHAAAADLAADGPPTAPGRGRGTRCSWSALSYRLFWLSSEGGRPMSGSRPIEVVFRY